MPFSSSCCKRLLFHAFLAASQRSRSILTPIVHRPLTADTRLAHVFVNDARPNFSAAAHSSNSSSSSERGILQWHHYDRHSCKASHCRNYSAQACPSTAIQGELLFSALSGNGGSDQIQTVSCSDDLRSTVCSHGTLSLQNVENDAIDAVLETKQLNVAHGTLQALEDMLKKVETSVPDGDPKIGALCLRLAQLCISNDENPDKILLYGQRAMTILGVSEISMECATCLEIIGCGHCKKGEFEKAVTHLERAAFILDKLKSTAKEEELGSLQYSVQALLGQANMSLGREEEALVNFQEALGVNERFLDAHDPNLAKSYHQIAQSFMQVQDLQEARATCLKALPIYTNCYGSASLQVAELRKLLSAIYYGLDNFENVLSEHEIIRPIFEAHGKLDELACLDLAAGEALLCLDKYTKAASKLKDAIKRTTPESHFHCQALLLLAKANAYSKKEKSAKAYCAKALEVLKNKTPSVEAGASAVELALVLKQLDELEQALSTFKIGFEFYKNYHNEKAAMAFIEGQIGLIYLTLGRTLESLPHLEACLASDANGLKDRELLDVYSQLGGAYLQQGKLEEALAKLEAGRAVAEECSILKDPTLATIYDNLATVYTTLGRLEEALSSQRHLVRILKSSGLKTEICLKNAEEKLEKLLHEAGKTR